MRGNIIGNTKYKDDKKGDEAGMDMRKLIEKSVSIAPEEFYLVESDLFIELSNMKEKPDFVVAFLELSSWMGTSLRSGVWTYYEATERDTVNKTIKYLYQFAPDDEISKMYALGNHNYSDEEYQTDFNYPQEWLDESEMIDKWIFDNERMIILFLQNILRMNMQND